MLEVGVKAPEFCLKDQDGNAHCLKDYLKQGKTVVLYFYPEDDTPGCTCEANEFTAISSSFAGKNAVVLGVSQNSIESHKRFEEKYGLGITLLSDPEKKVIGDYGVWGDKKLFGVPYKGLIRSTFVIGKNGKIILAFSNVKPEGHAKDVLEKI